MLDFKGLFNPLEQNNSKNKKLVKINLNFFLGFILVWQEKATEVMRLRWLSYS